jgi:hypothetical protein
VSWGAGKVTRATYAHRVSYEWARGPIPDGLEIDHLCQVPLCVNPDHLEVVTRAVNAKRVGERKRACANGHAYSTENVYVGPDGRRQCILCRRAALRRFRARHPEPTMSAEPRADMSDRRKAAGLSLSALGARLCLSASYLCMVETGRRRATPDVVAAYMSLPETV